MHGLEGGRLKAVVHIAVGELDEVGVLLGAARVEPLAGAKGDPLLVAFLVPRGSRGK